MIDVGGEIHLTIKKGMPYDLWRMVPLALSIPGLRLKNSFDFDPTLYPEYQHRRTLGYKEGVSSGANADITDGAKTYIFQRIELPDSDDETGDSNVKKKKSSSKKKKKRLGKRERMNTT
eukprot:m.140890 g.140890  ORF g.140890 m.140890 type:complete len:119 (-) comp14835_c0_seq1:4121-4477(-)